MQLTVLRQRRTLMGRIYSWKYWHSSTPRVKINRLSVFDQTKTPLVIRLRHQITTNIGTIPDNLHWVFHNDRGWWWFRSFLLPKIDNPSFYTRERNTGGIRQSPTHRQTFSFRIRHGSMTWSCTRHGFSLLASDVIVNHTCENSSPRNVVCRPTQPFFKLRGFTQSCDGIERMTGITICDSQQIQRNACLRKISSTWFTLHQ